MCRNTEVTAQYFQEFKTEPGFLPDIFHNRYPARNTSVI
jgi:hypothetical protein